MLGRNNVTELATPVSVGEMIIVLEVCPICRDVLSEMKSMFPYMVLDSIVEIPWNSWSIVIDYLGVMYTPDVLEHCIVPEYLRGEALMSNLNRSWDCLGSHYRGW